MDTSPSGNAADTLANRTSGTTSLATWLALLTGGGLALIFAFMASRGHRSEGPVRLTYQQSASRKGDGLLFELPPSWSVQYNGHQPWRGATLMDSTGRPRIEVWLHDGNCPWTALKERCDLPCGQVTCLTRSVPDARPFSSFPEVKNAETVVVERAFLLDRGYLMFRVQASQDTTLKPVIWECLRKLQRDETKPNALAR